MPRAWTNVVEGLRAGAWLTRPRVALVACLLLGAYALAVAVLLATSNGLTDIHGRPLGPDFSAVYAAGVMALEGRAAEAYDWPAIWTVQQRLAGDPAVPFYGWQYPPFLLFVAAPLSALPYLPALGVWLAATLAPFLAAMRAILTRLPREHTALALVLAAASPAVFINFIHGQNGFLTGFLLAGALLVLDRRSLLAGLALGLLAYKPQYGLLIPLVLAATGRWRAFAAAAATVTALGLVALAAFGPEVWRAFLASTELSRGVILEQGDPGFHKMQSLFAALRQWGAPIGVAHAAQGLWIAFVAFATLRLWRSPAAFEVKAAVLILGCVVATPYSMDYDLAAVLPALAFLAVDGFRRGFAPWEATLIAAAWLAPLVARGVAQATLLPLGFLATAALFVFVCHRAGAFVLPRSATSPGHA
jgi:hypothetical protein